MLLFGRSNFSGKLPMSFPKKENEVPANTPEQYPGVNGVATYSEKLQVGYRWYDANNVAPLFPFGFGLSYTTFKFDHLKVSPPAAHKANVEFDVTNTGAREGIEVAQVYVSAPSNAGEPPKQLKGFATVRLQPGQTQHVTITLDDRAFSIWSTQANKWTVEPGNYTILVGDSSRDLPLNGSVTIR